MLLGPDFHVAAELGEKHLGLAPRRVEAAPGQFELVLHLVQLDRGPHAALRELTLARDLALVEAHLLLRFAGSPELAAVLGPLRLDRSEEHTSELQSLMRISYAVFCLKKKQLLIKQMNL